MRTPTIARVRYPNPTAPLAPWRAIRKPAGMTPNQWKRAWARPFNAKNKLSSKLRRIAAANPELNLRYHSATTGSERGLPAYAQNCRFRPTATEMAEHRTYLQGLRDYALRQIGAVL